MKCPVLLIHGYEDEVIGYHHSVNLAERIKAPKEVCLQKGMSHNSYDMYVDIIQNILGFCKKYNHNIVNSSKIIDPKKFFTLRR